MALPAARSEPWAMQQTICSDAEPHVCTFHHSRALKSVWDVKFLHNVQDFTHSFLSVSGGNFKLITEMFMQQAFGSEITLISIQDSFLLGP